WRLARHDPAMVGADVEPAHIVAHDDKYVRRPLLLLLRRRGRASQTHGGNRQDRAEIDAADAHGVTLRANGCVIPATTYAQVKPCAIKFSSAALAARNAVEMSVLLQYHRPLFIITLPETERLREHIRCGRDVTKWAQPQLNCCSSQKHNSVCAAYTFGGDFDVRAT